MKKKGLIIATIVMVLVLAVSLTTATYAWFGTGTATKVEQISVKIAPASTVEVGVTSTYADTSADNYLYDAITVSGASSNTVSYADGTIGLGSSLSIPAFNLTTAVATTEDSSAYGTNVDSSFNPSHTIFKGNVAAGSAANVPGSVNTATSAVAVANTDYIDLRMGARAAKAGQEGLWVKVVVKTNDTAGTLKMNAALHFYIKTGASGNKTIEFDLFQNSGNTINYNQQKSTIGSVTSKTSGVVYTYEGTQAVATFYVFLAGAKSHNAANPDLYNAGSPAIYPFEIYGYVYGPDESCVSSATGCSLTIDMEFGSVNENSISTDPSAYVLDATA